MTSFRPRLIVIWSLLTAQWTGAIGAASTPGVQVWPVAPEGFAGSSVNVVAGLQSTLFTHAAHQYVAFYGPDGRLLLGRRALGAGDWTVVATPWRGRVHDAHNTVAIAVDGAGFLHVAWDHHGDPLNYSRSLAPESLELGPKQAMTGERENEVTYPQFLRLPNGELRFFYRDGRSGRGNLALKAYSPASGRWTDLHANLIDGEGQRSAYPAMTVDDAGALHLAWNWRDTPDVATNHDLCYARSADGGINWTTTAGAPLALPLRFDRAEYALRLPTGRSMMNPPALAVDAQGRPAITNYWIPDGSDVPQYHLVRYDGQRWAVSQITERTNAFVLAGSSTKRPPISRSALFFAKGGSAGERLHLVYRDDELGGRIVALSAPQAARGAWERRFLTDESVGAWEPSFDPEQVRQHGEFHALVQYVEQRDGNDRPGAEVPPTPVSVLAWDPTAERP